MKSNEVKRQLKDMKGGDDSERWQRNGENQTDGGDGESCDQSGK